MTMLSELITRSQGQRDALLDLLKRLESGEQTSWDAHDWSELAKHLRELGCVQEVFELKHHADQRQVQSLQLIEEVATAANDLQRWDVARALVQEAEALLAQAKNARQIETVFGCLGRFFKDQAFRASDDQQRTAAFEESLNQYELGYQKSLGIWCGVNTVALLFWLGRVEEAKARANTLLQGEEQRIEQALERDGDEPAHWVIASLAECHLIAGDLNEAERRYLQAHALVLKHRQYVHLNSMRKQLRRHLVCSHLSADLANHWLPQLGLAVVLPNTQNAQLATGFDDWLKQQSVRVMVTGLESEGQQAAAKHSLRRGIELHVVVSHEPIAANAKALFQQASVHKVLHPPGNTQASSDYVLEMLVAYARLTAHELDMNLLILGDAGALPALLAHALQQPQAELRS